MWFQVELPAAVSLTEVQFESTAPAGVAVDAVHRDGRGGPAEHGTPAAGGQPPAAPPVPVGRAVGPAASAPQSGGRRATREATRCRSRLDGRTWSAPVAEGQGTGATTVISFAPVNAKFVRITQTATVDGAPAWSIQRLRLYRVGGR